MKPALGKSAVGNAVVVVDAEAEGGRGALGNRNREQIAIAVVIIALSRIIGWIGQCPRRFFSVCLAHTHVSLRSIILTCAR